MSEDNGNSSTAGAGAGSAAHKGKLIRQIMARLGPGCSWEEVSRQMAEHGYSIYQKTFDANYEKLFGEDPPPRFKLAEKPPAQEMPQTETALADCDLLHNFIRFVSVVETIGGPGKARAYLELLENLRNVR